MLTPYFFTSVFFSWCPNESETLDEKGRLKNK